MKVRCSEHFPAQQFFGDEVQKEMGTVCDMTLNNIVDLYLFDDQDTFSCPNQCQNLDNCNYYTSYIRDGIHKCFLFKTCDNPEECDLCDTVPV